MEMPDPRNPPSGCHFHPRCPVGPLVDASRQVCIDSDPYEGAAARPHRAACHFAGARAGLDPQEEAHVARDR